MSQVSSQRVLAILLSGEMCSACKAVAADMRFAELGHLAVTLPIRRAILGEGGPLSSPSHSLGSLPSQKGN